MIDSKSRNDFLLYRYCHNSVNDINTVDTSRKSVDIFMPPPPFKEGGHIALLLSVHQQFPFIFFALVAHIEMKFGIQIYRKKSRSNTVLGMIEPFLTELCPLDFQKF
jgi:hypothetical protein